MTLTAVLDFFRPVPVLSEETRRLLIRAAEKRRAQARGVEVRDRWVRCGCGCLYQLGNRQCPRCAMGLEFAELCGARRSA